MNPYTQRNTIICREKNVNSCKRTTTKESCKLETKLLKQARESELIILPERKEAS